MKKQAKFFCENCGEEVAQNARFCKKCGRFFSAVRCPNCGKVGSSHSFANGCPSCGYAEKGKGQKASSPASSLNAQSGAQAKNHFYMHKPKYSSVKTKKSRSSNSLPVWIYALTFGSLVVMIILLMRCSY